jgi:Undecaprenyl-phosphate glucose phosphotransferase
MSVQITDRSSGQGVAIHGVANSTDALRSKSTRPTRLSVIFGYMLAIEFLIVAISTYLGSVLYHYISLGTLPGLRHYVDAALFIATAFTIISLGFRHFAVAKRQQLQVLLWIGVGAVTLSFIIFLAAIFLLKISSEYSRGAFIFEVISVGAAVSIFRTAFLFWFRTAIASGAIESCRSILIGDAKDHCLVEDLKARGIRVVASIPLPRETNAAPSDDCLPVLDSNIRNMIDLCRTMLPDDILILATQKDLSLASDLAHALSELPCNIHIAPVDEIKFLGKSHFADLGSVMTLQVSRPPLSLTELAIKRAFDIIVATMALIALSPLLLCVAAAIKIDSPGKALYRQRRQGYNNQVIRVFKFRSMTTEDDDSTFVPATRNDGRITTTGRFLRRTNIDELPQLINVLLGEMSIVGPRPHATVHNKMFENRILPFARRHNVKPGITGWAQVNGYRGAADTIDKMRRRVEYDLYYIDNWSFLLDLKIVMMTLFSRRAYTNAY